MLFYRRAALATWTHLWNEQGASFLKIQAASFIGGALKLSLSRTVQTDVFIVKTGSFPDKINPLFLFKNHQKVNVLN